jgi:hypothetical protein
MTFGVDHAILAYLERKFDKTSLRPAILDPITGRFSMPYPSAIKIGTAVGIAFGLGISLLFLWLGLKLNSRHANTPTAAEIVIWSIGGLIAIVTVFGIRETFLNRIQFSSFELIGNGLFDQTHIRWDQIIKVQYSDISRCVVLESAAGGRIRIHRHRCGLMDFSLTATAQLGPKLREEFQQIIDIKLKHVSSAIVATKPSEISATSQSPSNEVSDRFHRGSQ